VTIHCVWFLYGTNATLQSVFKEGVWAGAGDRPAWRRTSCSNLCWPHLLLCVCALLEPLELGIALSPGVHLLPSLWPHLELLELGTRLPHREDTTLTPSSHRVHPSRPRTHTESQLLLRGGFPQPARAQHIVAIHGKCTAEQGQGLCIHLCLHKCHYHSCTLCLAVTPSHPHSQNPRPCIRSRL
jgi:hypothetical protein